ncbi:hypothetical protein K504DRAFT_499215 [Pleomassaria siparia CBS 279.74]|uniref:Uncharacterized protein n=1 Tax=Pleomassaria siparia CBS 279.74 TaxID=1314801 RepID=A0A6G1KIB7_9PLEO|nr:hypothetical protein K504DRAFT_499215 [Pleomassaria siparia CBS 279.74]
MEGDEPDDSVCDPPPQVASILSPAHTHALEHPLTFAMDLQTKAAIGIGIPMALLVIILIMGMAYATMQKRLRDSIEELDAIKFKHAQAAAAAPKVKIIKWNPNKSQSKE